MCVKAVVFLTWWQSLAISLLQAVGLIHDISEQWTKDDVGQGLQV
jgi:Organic solute transporter Ostalpha